MIQGWNLWLCLIGLPFLSAEVSTCPCLTTDNGALNSYKVGGQLYYNDIAYPNDYGTGGCRAYDTDPSPLEPFCANSTGLISNAPAWCFDSFCYVDPANCNFRSTLTGIFPDSGLEYSYETCGGGSTFENWFGVNGTSSSTFDLKDLADVVEDYIAGLRRDIEISYVELDSLTTSCTHTDSGCPCSNCVPTEGWGTNISVDFGATMFKPHATTPATARSTCLAESTHSYFSKVAGSEYHDTSKFANLYGGFQEDGSLAMYPEFSWCPTDYDPRFRPWYSTASTNPKLLIVVIDISGSMATSNRIGLARSAALAVLDTLTWNDEIGFVLFNNLVREVYPITLCTDANRELMKTWVRTYILQSGGTNFILPLTKAFNMIENSTSSVCTKAILFLTDGDAAFSDDDFAYVELKAELHKVVMFTYALGSEAVTDVPYKLACDNFGMFYKVADGADLSEVMSGYYSYFAASISHTGARWILYNDFATSCTPMYDDSDPDSSLAVLIGVICMDMNMIVDVSRLRNHSQWNNLYSRVLSTSQACTAAWVGISAQEKLTILEELRTLNAGNGAELCYNEEIIEDHKSEDEVPWVIIIVVCCAVVVLVIAGMLYHKYKGGSKAVEPESDDSDKGDSKDDKETPAQSDDHPSHHQSNQVQPEAPVIQINVQQQQPVQPHFVPVQQRTVQPQPQYIQPNQQQTMQPQFLQPAQQRPVALQQPQYVPLPQQQPIQPQYIQPNQSVQPQYIQPNRNQPMQQPQYIQPQRRY